MASIGTEIKIPREDMEKFVETVVVDDLGSTFVRIAAEFLPNRGELAEQVQKTLEDAPLMAHMPLTIMADDHVAAKLGSVEDDPFGRLLHQTTMSFAIAGIWLQSALHRTIEAHGATPEHFVTWANRLGLFDDVTWRPAGECRGKPSSRRRARRRRKQRHQAPALPSRRPRLARVLAPRFVLFGTPGWQPPRLSPLIDPAIATPGYGIRIRNLGS